MRMIKTCLVFSVLLIVGLFASSAWAATYYVNNQAPSASDANPGTLDAPWLTIQHAADMVTAGDTIIVKPGLYNEGVRLSNSGTTSAPITFTGEPGAVLDGAGLDEYSNGYGFSNVTWTDSNSMAATPVDFIIMTGFEIRDFLRAGIYSSCARWDFANNKCVGGQGWVIKNNVIHGSWEGISLWGLRTPEGANIIVGNYLYDNGWTDIHTHYDSVVERNVALSHTTGENIRSCSGPGQKVNNNTVMNGTYGIMAVNLYHEYKNNIVMNIQPRVWHDYLGQTYTEGGFAFRTYQTVLPLINISFNDIYNVYNPLGRSYSSPYYSFYESYQLPANAGNISADPLFVNNTGDHTGDYHLTANSPCIDAGDPADPVPTGGGSRIDIGAYEFTQQQMDIPALISEKHKFYDAGLIDNKGIMTSLDAKLNAAQAALVRGEPKTARNILSAMINEARAQAGKHVDAGAAQALIEDAEMILQQIDFIETKSSKK